MRYAGERQQFGKPLSAFGLVQQKFGDQAAKLFAAESATYRTAAAIDAVMATGERVDSIAPPFPRALDEFALECSILKVACSEVLDEVADETLQVHGGYGYTEEFPAARGYRDARINRIFEGTNEINRLFIPGLLMRRAQRGRFPLMAAVSKVSKEMLDFAPVEESSDPLVNAGMLLSGAKRLVLLLSGIAYQKFGEGLVDQQEILGAISDLVIDVYLGESALLRARKLAGAAAPGGAMATDLALVFINDSVGRMEQRARTALGAISTGDELKTQLGFVRRLLKWAPVNTVMLRRRISDRLCEVGGFRGLVAPR